MYQRTLLVIFAISAGLTNAQIHQDSHQHAHVAPAAAPDVITPQALKQSERHDAPLTGSGSNKAGISNNNKNNLWQKDEIYIDSDEMEGSGLSRDDDEEDDDLEGSGSGYGPDDEDAGKTYPDFEVDANVPGKKWDEKGEKHDRKQEPTDTNKIDDSKGGAAPDLGDKKKASVDVATGGDHEDNDLHIWGRKHDERDGASFFAQPGILAAVIGGAVVGLLCAILLVMFIVYRMRKMDEGSYALDEPKRSPTAHPYTKGSNREFYA